MPSIQIVEAGKSQSNLVAMLVKKLLVELEPEASEQIGAVDWEQITAGLFGAQKIVAFLAFSDNDPVGVITLHECAAIYAGGLFGEISELYVLPEFRSCHVGRLLLQAAVQKAESCQWKRLEVGSPPRESWARTIRFYESHNFQATGTRLRLLI